MNSYDVIVIGVGGWGSAVLWQLAGQRIIAVRIPPHRCTGTMLRSGVLPIVPPPHMDRGLSSQDARFSPSSDWRDPRLEPDFVAGCFPLCEGKDSPPVGTEDLKDRRKLEFVAAYYRINCAYERLAAASENDRRTAVLALNSQLSARDELEDRYAPIGFLAEPRLQGVQTVDLTFMHAPETPPPTPGLLSSAFSISPPLSIPVEASVQVMDLAGFQRFLEGEMDRTAPRDAEAHS